MESFWGQLYFLNHPIGESTLELSLRVRVDEPCNFYFCHLRPERLSCSCVALPLLKPVFFLSLFLWDFFLLRGSCVAPAEPPALQACRSLDNDNQSQLERISHSCTLIFQGFQRLLLPVFNLMVGKSRVICHNDDNISVWFLEACPSPIQQYLCNYGRIEGMVCF